MHMHVLCGRAALMLPLRTSPTFFSFEQREVPVAPISFQLINRLHHAVQSPINLNSDLLEL
jgi:hypothetical protein